MTDDKKRNVFLIMLAAFLAYQLWPGQSVSLKDFKRFYQQHRGGGSDPARIGNQIYGAFKDGIGGRAWLVTIHGYVDNKRTCEELIAPLNADPTIGDFPGRYLCLPITPEALSSIS